MATATIPTPPIQILNPSALSHSAVTYHHSYDPQQSAAAYQIIQLPVIPSVDPYSVETVNIACAPTRVDLALSTSPHHFLAMTNNINQHHNGAPILAQDNGSMGAGNGFMAESISGVVAHSTAGSDGSGPTVTLTIRLIMQGKEVGSIIGKKGDNIKKFREESGAKINISDGSCPERIVTVSGSTEAILKAFSLIARKLAEDLQSNPSPLPNASPVGAVAGAMGPGGKPQVTLRLIVPASQCGSLIGKGGAKIKEIREITGATIQVASEMLPNSTERSVTVSGCSDAITKCIYQICCVMMECPPKGATIPYRPKPVMAPVVFAGGQAYTIQGQYAIPHVNPTDQQFNWAHVSPLSTNPQTGPTMGGIPTGGSTAGSAQQAGMGHSSAGAGLGNPSPSGASHQPPVELSIPNDLIGCIIGKGGAKINEIRQLSGANIKIANSEDGSKDRTVSISGSPEAVGLAQYLINTSIQNAQLPLFWKPNNNQLTALPMK